MINKEISNSEGHLFILCGPPGSGKTTLLKMINESESTFNLIQVQRLTTRKSRKDEGDNDKSSIEYEFLTHNEFAGRISRGNAANLIEWNGNYYSTETEPIEKIMKGGQNCLLLEDIPSSLVLKKHFGTKTTIIFLFTDDKEELLKLEFGSIKESKKHSIIEWKRRLSLKYMASQIIMEIDENKKMEYIESKMCRAIPDLAFISGKIRMGEDIRVLANRKDKQKETLNMFRQVVKSISYSTISEELSGNFAFVLMPFRDNFNKLYRFVIKPAVENEGLSCLRGDEIFSKLEIVDDIMKHIESSSLIISDISGGNPNVFLELGVSMKLNKPIILLSQDAEAPFDVRTCRWIKYEDTLQGWEYLSNQLLDTIRKVKRREDIQKGSQNISKEN